jgi:hypothetical protein
VIRERKVFYPVKGKSLKTKKDCLQSFLYRFNAENYSGFISKVRQGGKERTTLKTNVSAYANFACEVKPARAAAATVHIARLGVRDAANAVSPMKWKRITVRQAPKP